MIGIVRGCGLLHVKCYWLGSSDFQKPSIRVNSIDRETVAWRVRGGFGAWG
jgi:hypothetical protein